ncbi:MAG: fibronectin type III domain-containing protein, partial [Gaiellaceae bacterium]
SNGDVSTVQSLLANPGPDGISLREALQATNNDPGHYGIRFASLLAGATIRVGVAPPGFPSTDLPALTGGGVDIDGDIDGDGRPDVTIMNEVQGPADCGEQCGFTIASSGNRLHALTLRGFTTGVLFFASSPPHALLSNHTFANNVVSNLVIQDTSANGIVLLPTSTYNECSDRGPACQTHNSWVDTQLVGNTIEARDAGIDIHLATTIGERVERLTVTGNTIRSEGRAGINLTAGAGAGSDGNALSGVLLAENTIEGHAMFGFRLSSGEGGAHKNTVEKVRMTGNNIDLAVGSRPDRAEIVIAAGDGGTDYLFPDMRPIVYSEGNLLRDVEISRNTLAEGPGVWVEAGVGGDKDNAVEHVRIANNEIRRAGPDAAIQVESGSSAFLFTRATTGARVSDVLIDSNHVAFSSGAWVSSPMQFPPYAGILLVGGDASSSGVMTGVSVTNNRLENAPIGISLLAGEGAHAKGDAFDLVPNNQISRTLVRGNVVTGYLRSGLLAIGGSGCNGNRYTIRGNAIRDLKIERNTLTAKAGRARTNGVEIIGGAGCGESVSQNGVTAVHILDNMIHGNTVGIRLAGGRGATARRNSVRVELAKNRMDRNADPVRIRDDQAGAARNVVRVILLPAVRYSAVTVAPTSATLKALIDPRGLDTTCFVRYGRSKRYGASTPRRTIKASAGRQTITWRVTGLRPGTTYHYRVVARSRGGKALGRDSTFKTKSVRA